MVRELDVKNCQCGCASNMYQCESCGFMFADSKIALQCEDYCGRHQSYSEEIVERGIKCC